MPARRLRKLPASLARNDARAASRKLAELRAQGEEDVALIRRRMARIREDFYDIGEALTRLRAPGVAQALGFRSFEQLLAGRVGLSGTQAALLMRIVERVKRSDAVGLERSRIAALIELADATPEPDTPVELENATLKLPSGKRLEVARASANEIAAAAREIRAAHRPAGHRPRGRTTTAAERAFAATVQSRLRALGFDRAEARAVATRPGQGADIAIAHVPIEEAKKLGKLFRA